MFQQMRSARPSEEGEEEKEEEREVIEWRGQEEEGREAGENNRVSGAGGANEEFS